MFYIILLVLSLFVICMAYIKIKYRFWSKQPVFHYYNIWYWLSPPGVIEYTFPKINEYVNNINIKMKSIGVLDKDEKTRIVSFIKENYLRTKSAMYLPKNKHVMTYFENSKHNSYICIYNKSALVDSNKYISQQKYITEDETLGLITARPLNVTLKNKPVFSIYYIDNLCVHANHRKKGIAPKLIQTLYHNISRENPKINKYLFKREGEMTAIVPLTTFTTKGYFIKDIPVSNLPHSMYRSIEITNANIQLAVEFIYQQTKTYECVIVPDLPNLMTLVKSNQLYLSGIMDGDKLVALYVFRDPALQYNIDSQKNSPNTIECISTLIDKSYECLLSSGFYISLCNCRKKYKSRYVLIENTSCNNHILSYITATPFVVSPTAFFFYNYGIRPMQSDKVFLIY